MLITLKRSQLNKKYNLNKNLWNRRHDELMDYLNEYMNIRQEISGTGRYIYIIEGEAPQSIPPLPRKSYKEARREAYKNYILTNELTNDFIPNSKAKVARDSKRDFSQKDYGHTFVPSIVQRYVGPIMDEYGEKSKQHVWVDYDTYKELPQDEVDDLRFMFKQAKLSEGEMATAWIRENQGDDVTKEKIEFKTVINKFVFKYGHRPILVAKWRLKQIEKDNGDIA